ncbi:PKD domain-containing protein [Maribacter sp. Asnod1-A12]|uniref:PKD domain-containing protein n=1 Tax=Maribacter sp. Asnod1-A12 TaxID=3160576 RepID=UPI00386BF01B
MKKFYILLGLFIALIACSDYDEQEFTVLLPNAGEDQIIFTEETGTTIQLNGEGSTDVNNLGFTYQWEVTNAPDGFEYTIENSDSALPILTVANNASGRYNLTLTITKGNQQAQDFVNIDINPVIAQVLLVNTIDADIDAILSVPELDITGNAVAKHSADDTYYNIDLNVAQNSDGNVVLNVNYNGTTLSIEESLGALKNYTIYLIGTEIAPELLLVEKTKNANTIPIGIVGLDAINLSPGLENVELYIDATSFNFGIVPVDLLFGQLGVVESFGLLSYKDNSEIFYSATSIFPLAIWGAVNQERVTNDTFISLTNGESGKFGTFVIVKDASSTEGNKIIFINNSSLLPE